MGELGMGEYRVGRFSFDRAWLRTLPTKLAGVRGTVVALGLMVVAQTSPSNAQTTVDLGTAGNFGVLAGSTVTNTGSTVINGFLGVSPGTAVTGFPPGTATAIHAADAVALQGQVDLTTAYLNALSRPTTVNLTGVNLGGLTLGPGVYNFDTSAQLTGLLTLNGLNNPNSVFIFNIGSTLTTASASIVSLINSAQGGNVFFRVGSSATLGTTTSFIGNILALTSITLNTGATLSCGRALARNGAVTLDTNTITICTVIPATTTTTTTTTAATTTAATTTAATTTAATTTVAAVLGPAGFALFSSLLPASANNSQTAVATTLDTFISNGGTLPLAFANLFNLSPSDLAGAFSQLQGEVGTGAAQAGTQAMNSFLSLVTSPFGYSRGLAPEIPLPARPVLIFKAPVYKAPVYKAPAQAASDPRRWSVWGAAYGGQTNATGDPLAGSNDRSVRTIGYATGLDYRVTPYTVVGFALGGGATSFGLSGGFGAGHSNMFQAAVYSLTSVNAAYFSTALAYAWHHVTTDRYLTVAGTDHLTADFDANNVGGRIEGGYRFAIPGVFGWPGFGVTPYAALQVQAFRSPLYSEIAASGSSIFALAFNARTTTTTRSELGSWVDKTYVLNHDSALTAFGRAAWAHDWYSDPTVTATFLSLPGASFIETGAVPAKDSALLSGGLQLSMRNGWSVMAKVDTEFAQHSQTYMGTAQLRYTW